MRMRWRDLLFAHWVVDPAALRPLIPSSLVIDTFEGGAYLGVVPFGMEDVAPRGLPAVPHLSVFPEVNVRTYVRDGDAVVYRSTRLDRRGRPADLDVRYQPTGPARPAPPGSLDRWLTHRLRLFAVDGRGRVSSASIAHAAWPLRPAEAEFRVETLSSAQGLELSGPPVHLAFADRLDVRAWWPRRVGHRWRPAERPSQAGSGRSFTCRP